MSTERWRNNTDSRKTEVLKERHGPSAILCTTNPTRTELELNPLALFQTYGEFILRHTHYRVPSVNACLNKNRFHSLFQKIVGMISNMATFLC